MQNQNHSEIRTGCYQSARGKTTLLLAAGLIIVGIILAVWCVPLWVWLAAAGAALIVLGVLLLRK